MIYKVTRFEHFLEICKWVMHLDNPELELKHVRINSYMTHVIASGSGETMLLLKYGHILEQVL